MNVHFWRILGGIVRVGMVVLPFWIAWWIVLFLDNQWGWLWQLLSRRPIPLVGFFLSIIISYLVGLLSETKSGLWLDEHIFKKMPIVGYFFVSFNPSVRKLLKKAKGAIGGRFQSGWRMAFVTAVHATADGHWVSVGYIGFPPIPQQIAGTEKVRVRKIVQGGEVSYQMIPRQVAIQQELSFGTTVPDDAYKDVVEVTCKEFVESFLLGNGQGE